MTPHSPLSRLAALVLLACATPAANADGFTTLFDGSNLDAWQTSSNAGWTIEDDGVLFLKNRTDGALNNPDYLWTKETYGDFVLELEFKVCEGYCNSGIFLRTADLRDPVFTGIEVQVTNSRQRKGLSRGGTAGAVYDCLAPTKNAVRAPGEWNRYSITCRGALIIVDLNGERVLEMDLDRWTETGKNPDGTPNKYKQPLKDFARRGHIGLQDHGRPVWYRNMRVRRLDAKSSAAGRAYTLTPDAHGQLLKTPDGRPVLRYMTKKPAKTNLTANSVCCLFPVWTPSGVRAVDFAPGDHRHHRGVFLARHSTTFGDARADFRGWGHFAPTKHRVIRNRSVDLVRADAAHAELDVRNVWTVGDRVVLDEQLAVTVREKSGVFVTDLDFRLVPRVDLTLDQSAFGGFCVKGRKGVKGGVATYHDPSGEVKRPRPHHLKPETDWPASPWYDWVVALEDGKTIGVAVVDHPANPKSTWHNLQPIAMVNPCIVAPNAIHTQAGDTLRLRYRVVTHDGPPPRRVLEELAAEWRGQN